MQFLPTFQPMPRQFPSHGPWTASNPVNLLSMAPSDTESPFASWGHLCWLCPLPAPRAPPACSLVEYKKLKSPWLGANIT